MCACVLIEVATFLYGSVWDKVLQRISDFSIAVGG